MFRTIIWFLACLGLAGCQQAKQSDKLSIKQLIEFYKDAPLGKSIGDVSHGLGRCTIFVPTEGIHEQGKKLNLKTSLDNQGKEWTYIYTDKSSLLAAFPAGSPFVKVRFADFFDIIEKDPKFGGVFINSMDKYKYLIPREVFKSVRNVLDSDPDSKNIPLE